VTVVHAAHNAVRSSFEVLFHDIVVWCALQVQLLVSDSDVESYKQIKFDLDELRLLVEKSELWVYKSKGEGKMEKKADNAEESAEVMSLTVDGSYGLSLNLTSVSN